MSKTLVRIKSDCVVPTSTMEWIGKQQLSASFLPSAPEPVPVGDVVSPHEACAQAGSPHSIGIAVEQVVAVGDDGEILVARLRIRNAAGAHASSNVISLACTVLLRVLYLLPLSRRPWSMRTIPHLPLATVIRLPLHRRPRKRPERYRSPRTSRGHRGRCVAARCPGLPR